MIQNQAGARLAPLGNFCNIARCPVVLLKISTLVNVYKCLLLQGYILLFGVHPPGRQTNG